MIRPALAALLSAVVLVPSAAQDGRRPRPDARDIVQIGPDGQPLAAGLREVYAVLIGVNEYTYEDKDKIKLSDLGYCDRDALRLRSLLLMRGAKPENVVVLHDGAPDNLKPTCDNINAQLDAMFGTVDGKKAGRASASGKNAEIWFAFSGHGFYDEDLKVSVLAPRDTSHTFYRADGQDYSPTKPPDRVRRDKKIPVSDVAKRLTNVRDAHVRLMFVDACRSTFRTHLKAALPVNDGGAMKSLLPGKDGDGKLDGPIWVYNSCSVAQKSWEDRFLRHGMFTANLLDCLRGAGHSYLDLGSPVQTLGLYDQLAKKVTSRASWWQAVSLDRGQKPTFLPPPGELKQVDLLESLAFVNSLDMTMLRVPTADGVFGSPPDEARRAAGDEFLQHPVQFIPRRLRLPAVARTKELQDAVVREFGAGVLEPLRTQVYLGKTEVTQRQYERLTEKNPSHFQYENMKDKDIDFPFDTTQFPVESVTWSEAAAFCEALTDRENRLLAEKKKWYRVRYRLPTEEEWEFACRAGTATPFGVGADLSDVEFLYARVLGSHIQVEAVQNLGVFNTVEPYTPAMQAEVDKRKKYVLPHAHPQPAGETRNPPPELARATYALVSNDWGFEDMHGNVAEWTATKFDKPARTSTPDEKWPEPVLRMGVNDYAVVRGGAWTDPAHQCRAASRERHSCWWDKKKPAEVAVADGHRIGFRVACDVVYFRK